MFYHYITGQSHVLWSLTSCYFLTKWPPEGVIESPPKGNVSTPASRPKSSASKLPIAAIPICNGKLPNIELTSEGHSTWHILLWILFHQKIPLQLPPAGLRTSPLRQAMQLPRIEEEHLEVRKVGRWPLHRFNKNNMNDGTNQGI